jgi:hypothetical protein
MTGTGTISLTVSALRNNLTFNTAGTITIASGSLLYNTGTLTYTAGTMVVTGSTLNQSLATTLNTSGMTWNDVTISYTGTETLSSNLNVGGNLILGVTGSAQVLTGAFNINVTGNVTVNVTTGTVSGTATIVMVGTGILSTPLITTGAFRNNLTFNTAGTITVSGVVTFNTGTLTYTTGTMVVAGSELRTAGVGCTLNTGGMTWNDATLAGTATYTLTSNLNIGGTFFNTSTTLTTTYNGAFNINVGGSLTLSTTSGILNGTASFVMNGTGTWSMPSVTTGRLRNNLTFNTAGTITVSGTVDYGTGTLTYTAGTMSLGTSIIYFIESATLATNGVTWFDTWIGNTSTQTLSNNFQTTTLTVGSATDTFNGFAISAVNLLNNGGASVLAGSTAITITGGTVSGTAITLNNSGGLTFAGAITWTVTTFTRTAGTVTATGSTLTLSGSSTFAGATTWNNWTTSGTGTLTTNALQTLAGTMTVGGGFTTTFAGTNGVLSCANLTLGSASTLVQAIASTVTGTTTINAGGSVINGAFTLNTGGLTMNGNLTGTLTLINFNATGTWSGSGVVIHNTTVNTAGTLTISGTVHYKTGTFTYTAGTVTVTSSTLSIDGSCTFAGALTWNNWTVAIASTVTINSLQTLSGTLTLQVTTIFAGTNGWTTNSFVCTTAGLTHTFKNAITYTTTGTMMMLGTAKNKIKFISASPPTKAILTFTNPQTVYYVSPTDIDSSAGNPVATLGGTITNTLNWNNIQHPAIVTITG